MSSDVAVMGARGAGAGGGAGWGEYSDRGTTWDEPKERNEEEEYDKEDSDGDYGYRKPTNKENVYRDSEAVSSSPPRARAAPAGPPGRALSINLRSPAKKNSTPVKKIDLGAAASYGKPSGPPPPTPPPSAAAEGSQDLLDDLFKTCPVPGPTPGPTPGNAGSGGLGLLEDDFDPRAGESKPPRDEFGDFTNAFGAPAAPAPAADHTEFADFSSAFTAGDVLDMSSPPPPPPDNHSSVSNLDLLSSLAAPPPGAGGAPGAPLLDSLPDALAAQLAAATLQPQGLQPTAAGPLRPAGPPPAPAAGAKPAAAKLGATWADTTGAINIDVDNLLAPRSPKAGPTPSMNQLKSSPNSPAHMNPNPMMGGFAPFVSPINLNNNFASTGLNNNVRPPFANHNSFLQ